MKIKKDRAIAGIDMIIAIIAISIFSTLIISMMYNNVIENVKLKKETLAMIYITEIFENVGIKSYDDEAYNSLGSEYVQLTEANNIVPQSVLDNGYKVEMAVITELEDVTNYEDILKKIKVRLTYEVGNKNYTCSMERMKIKE